MKLKNILSILVVFLMATACSSEDDVLNDISKETIDNQSGDGYAALNIKIGNPVTRSESMTSEDNCDEFEEITNCTVILLDQTEEATTGPAQGDVFAVVANPGIVDTGIVGWEKEIQDKLIFKERDNNVIVLMIANSSQDYSHCSTYQEVRSVLQNENDLDRMVKVAQHVIYPIDMQGKFYSSLTEAKNNPIEAIIKLEQLTAVVELVGFKINQFNGSPADVEITNVELLNVNPTSYTDTPSSNQSYSRDSKSANEYLGAALITKQKEVSVKVYDAASGNISSTDVLARFFTFPNTQQENPVTMKITFTVGGEERSASYIINRPDEKGFTNNSGHQYIQAKYIYRIFVNMTIKNGVECTFNCTVNDWKDSYLSVDMEPVNE